MAQVGGTATVRIFASLRLICEERGTPTTVEFPVSAEGTPAREIAEALDIPLEKVEGVFVNHKAHGINYLVRPGDRMAFVPYDTPGPHRFALGLYKAGKDDDA